MTYNYNKDESSIAAVILGNCRCINSWAVEHFDVKNFLFHKGARKRILFFNDSAIMAITPSSP